MYYVLFVNVCGNTEHVESFNTREEAIEYISKSDDDNYMVVLRNDDLRMKNHLFE
jgi:hypothetical protein